MGRLAHERVDCRMASKAQDEYQTESRTDSILYARLLLVQSIEGCKVMKLRE